MSGYTRQELSDIELWLSAGYSASQIATRLSVQRHEPLSRNAIISVVHRTPKLKAIGFARSSGGQQGGRPRKDRMSAVPKPARKPKVAPTKPRLPKAISPSTLPQRLALREFVRAFPSPKVEAHFNYRVPIPRPPAATKRPPFVGMLFLDCLFDRCRMPLDLDSHAKGGPDMLCCGIKVEAPKSFCTHCESRLHARREQSFQAAA